MNPNLPIKTLDEASPDNLIAEISEDAPNPETTNGLPPHFWAYVVAILSYIPVVGLGLGWCAMIWGLVQWRNGGRWVAILGFGGIWFTVFLYGGLLAKLLHTPFLSETHTLNQQLTQSNLNALVQAIEFHKGQYGHYPIDLSELLKQPYNDFILINDPMSRQPAALLYYRRVGESHYYLRSVGVDNQVFTDDDIVPQTQGRIGLLRHQTPITESSHPNLFRQPETLKEY